MDIPRINTMGHDTDPRNLVMSSQAENEELYALYLEKLQAYTGRFHQPYLHAGEIYPQGYQAKIKDIQRHLDSDVPRPWVDFPDDCYV